jgi:hypothetical protein
MGTSSCTFVLPAIFFKRIGWQSRAGIRNLWFRCSCHVGDDHHLVQWGPAVWMTCSRACPPQRVLILLAAESTATLDALMMMMMVMVVVDAVEGTVICWQAWQVRAK